MFGPRPYWWTAPFIWETCSLSLGSGVFFLFFGLWRVSEDLWWRSTGRAFGFGWFGCVRLRVCVFGDVVPICGFLSQDRDQEKPKLKRSSSCCNLRKALLAIAFDINMSKRNKLTTVPQKMSLFAEVRKATDQIEKGAGKGKRETLLHVIRKKSSLIYTWKTCPLGVFSPTPSKWNLVLIRIIHSGATVRLQPIKPSLKLIVSFQ